MLRAYLGESKRCYGHPHRIVETACVRCRMPYCDECLTARHDGLFGRIASRGVKGQAALFCGRCVAEVEALNVLETARSRPLWQRLRPTRAGIHRAAIYVAVIAVILVPLSILARQLASATVTPEDLARIKFGLRGTFQTAEGTDFLSQVYGGRFLRANAPSQPDHDPSRLIDTWATAAVPGWRSSEARFPQELVFALPRPLTVSKASLLPQPAEPPATWVRDFEVLLSNVSPESGFVSVTSGTLDVEQARSAIDPDHPGTPPRFVFPETTARYVMLRVLSNNGSTDYTSLGEFLIFWQKQ